MTTTYSTYEPTEQDIQAYSEDQTKIEAEKYRTVKLTTVTYTTMLMTGGSQGTVYGIYQGRIRYRKGIPHSINSNKSIRVGTVKVPQGEERRSYFEMARQFETPSHPAFDWGRT